MISIRSNEEDIVAVMKLIKRHFSRLVRTHYNEVEYISCKNNIDLMYRKIEDIMDEKYDWFQDYEIKVKSVALINDLKKVKSIYESFIQYNKTPNKPMKYKVEIDLSMNLAKVLNRFLDKEVDFQILFNKKSFNGLDKIKSFQNDLLSSINSFEDKSIFISIKADEYKSWEKIIEGDYEEEYQDSEFNIRETENNPFEGRFSEESELFKLGYKITGLSRPQRWRILADKAVPQLGLATTVNIISGLIETRKLQQNGEIKYANAINEWNYDLSKLADYYLLKK